MHDERHAIPSPDGGWDLLAAGATGVASHHNTASEAVQRAREILLDDEDGGELLLHDRDGDVQAKVRFRPSAEPVRTDRRCA